MALGAAAWVRSRRERVELRTTTITRSSKAFPESAPFLVGADELCLRNHMTLHCIQKLSFRRVPEIR